MSDVEFCGESFAVPERVDQAAVFAFAAAASTGGDVVGHWAATWRMLLGVIRPEDERRFTDACSRARASEDELMEFAGRMLAAISGRPTSRPSDSSDGPPTTVTSSGDVSSSPVVVRLVAQGRPDLAQIVEMASA